MLSSLSKPGLFSDVEALCFAKIACAIDLQVIEDLMSTSLAFAVASDILTNDFGNSLSDVHARFFSITINDLLLSFYLSRIPLFRKSYSRKPLFALFRTVMKAIRLV